jgi:peroxin-5
VLQLEATAQREPTNARAWFDLGVKQQENERETQALRALRRAVALDPSHLPGWLALATSSTNEGLRQDTLDAVREWIVRNERYTRAVAAHGGPGETFESMVACLIAMVRDAGEEVDADVQIALAVLLNSNEVRARPELASNSRLNTTFRITRRRTTVSRLRWLSAQMYASVSFLGLCVA